MFVLRLMSACIKQFSFFISADAFYAIFSAGASSNGLDSDINGFLQINNSQTQYTITYLGCIISNVTDPRPCTHARNCFISVINAFENMHIYLLSHPSASRLRHARTYSVTQKHNLSPTQPQMRQATHQAVAHSASESTLCPSN